MEKRPSSIAFGSFLVYPSHARSGEPLRIKQAVLGIKEDRYSPAARMRMPEFAAKRLRESLSDSALETFFAGNPILIPVPRSSLLKKDTLWPALRICEALVAEGLAGEYQVVLERTTPIRKSATTSDRPSPLEHYRTLIAGLPPQTNRVILVDDVITRGASVLGASWRLRDVMPSAKIRAFAAARTVNERDVLAAIDIVVGRVSLSENGQLLRRP